VTSVRDERVVKTPDGGERSRRFWLHLLDNFIRRWPLYLLPVVLMFALGASVANDTVALYSSSANLDASENPLLGELDLRGTNTGKRLTAAQATSRLVQEQLRTDVFATAVAVESGLGPALENGLVSTGAIRRNVSASANGDSIMVIKATWADPITAQSLAQAAIKTYRDYVVETVSNDSVSAVEFYTELQEQAFEEVAAAQLALEDYVGALSPLPEGAVRPIEQELTITRLNGALARADEKVDAARTEIESATLQLAQARSEAGQSVRVIDPPNQPFAPGPRTSTMASIVLAFGALGLVISGTALVLTTALDRSVRFAPDLTDATGLAIVATVPDLKVLRRRGKKARRADKKRRRTKSSPEDDVESEYEDDEDVLEAGHEDDEEVLQSGYEDDEGDVESGYEDDEGDVESGYEDDEGDVESGYEDDEDDVESGYEDDEDVLEADRGDEFEPASDRKTSRSRKRKRKRNRDSLVNRGAAILGGNGSSRQPVEAQS
jgi:capsular polysaccharide biosynthesis protein